MRKAQSVEWEKYSQIVLFSINLGISLFVLPVLLLFYVQVRNILLNKTTYEQARGQRTDSRLSKKVGGVMANCKAMCSDNR